MSEHRIRLRAAWQWRPRDQEDEAPRRIDLPASWTVVGSGPMLLTRRFRRPPLETGRERARLLLEDVPGLRSVRLNGVELARPAAGTAALTLDLEGHLLPSNELVLEVDPVGWTAPGANAGPWGAIALVIGPA